MSKKEKPSKEVKETKGGDDKLGKASATYESAKKARQEASAAVKAFESENKLPPMKKGGHGDDPKHGKAWKKLKSVWKEAKAAEEAAETTLKALKPKTERLSGKYEYPADCTTSEDKKKYRTKARAAAKAAEKGEAKPSKKDKTKKEEAPVEEVKSSKKSKDGKKKKKKVAAED